MNSLYSFLLSDAIHFALIHQFNLREMFLYNLQWSQQRQFIKFWSNGHTPRSAVEHTCSTFKGPVQVAEPQWWSDVVQRQWSMSDGSLLHPPHPCAHDGHARGEICSVQMAFSTNFGGVFAALADLHNFFSESGRRATQTAFAIKRRNLFPVKSSHVVFYFYHSNLAICLDRLSFVLAECFVLMIVNRSH